MPAATTVHLASGIVLSYAATGPADSLALVMVPGPTDSWRSYERILDQLPSSLHAVAVSPRGHGDSDKPVSGYTVDDFASDTVELLDALRIEQAVLAGHSGSCLAVRQVAIRHPERVAGLVLEASPTTLRGNAGVESFVASVIDGLEDPIDPDFAAAWVMDTSTADLAQEDVRALVDEVLKVPSRVWREMFRALITYDDTADLPKVVAPTLLVWGDADPLVTRAAQDSLLKVIPSSTLSVYAGAGHTPRWEQPQRFANEMASFVSAHRL